MKLKDILTEIDRRGFLKAVGGVALGAVQAAGVGALGVAGVKYGLDIAEWYEEKQQQKRRKARLSRDRYEPLGYIKGGQEVSLEKGLAPIISTSIPKQPKGIYVGQQFIVFPAHPIVTRKGNIRAVSLTVVYGCDSGKVFHAHGMDWMSSPDFGGRTEDGEYVEGPFGLNFDLNDFLVLAKRYLQKQC